MDPAPGVSEFAEFADALEGQRVQSERVVRLALRRAGDHSSTVVLDELNAVARAIDGTLGNLDRAAEELRTQNEALFAARVELESASAVFLDLFELAPAAYMVTTPDTRVVYANRAACTLLGRQKNALAGKPLICHVPLEDRAAFRAAVIRSGSDTAVSEWSATVFPIDAATKIACRMRIRPVSSLGAHMRRALFWIITEETDEDLF